ncbi:hypothetical protein J6590_038467 [Homalodisca vitripennis]|nr:hypothetical protein J6590_038467 [Homalodisca vitripennis]
MLFSTSHTSGRNYPSHVKTVGIGGITTRIITFPIRVAVKGGNPKVCFSPPSVELEDTAHRETLLCAIAFSTAPAVSEGEVKKKQPLRAGCQAWNV